MIKSSVKIDFQQTMFYIWITCYTIAKHRTSDPVSD